MVKSQVSKSFSITPEKGGKRRSTETEGVLFKVNFLAGLSQEGLLNQKASYLVYYQKCANITSSKPC